MAIRGEVATAKRLAIASILVRPLSMVSAVAYTILATIAVGIDEFGRFAFVFSVATVVAIFPALQGHLQLMRAVKSDRSLIVWTTVFAAGGGLGAYISTFAMLRSLGIATDLFSGESVIALTGYVALNGIISILPAFSILTHEPIRSSILSSVRGPIRVISVLPLVFFDGAGSTQLGVAESLASLVTLVVSLCLLRGNVAFLEVVRSRCRPSLNIVKRGCQLSLGQFSTTIIQRSDLITMGALHLDPASIGLYALILRLLDGVLQIYNSAISPVVRPFSTTSGTALVDLYRRVTQAASLAVGASMCILCVVAPLAVRSLGAGEFQKVNSAAGVITILAIGTWVSKSSGPVSLVLASHQLDGAIARAGFVAAGLNIFLNLLLIPGLSLYGAALSTSLSACVLVAEQYRRLDGPARKVVQSTLVLWPRTSAPTLVGFFLSYLLTSLPHAPGSVLVAVLGTIAIASAYLLVGMLAGLHRQIVPDARGVVRRRTGGPLNLSDAPSTMGAD